ncbi:nicotinate-nucleotide--dimethylbenzimidazole phosphoribosyltransferase [Chitinophagaceae bacterium LB-8]|uniref:Nicotinate-nucleotide--dimethylbenzimidazole phosphoribosyltransferase n=1 Tax=Paraflavisolibacter caeni TaxID=2982496 RepID=A0A9X2XPT2_9BACT|nr:nicotinate-nucleotide--dimethylbenzimidazole phosphoribosyltransferase [Paraflavisolibacter caeni]MCU7551729.1 nicotinate-nucleotide--dimethylbenzimidazole phosphoribosyltransferase [Paraflavisolibacter caeni]
MNQEFNNMKEEYLEQQLRQKINSKTKPIGALGYLENIALQVGCIQQTLSPVITNPHVIVFAGDHGVAQTELVNPYPQAVTAQMVLNFLEGGAAINVFCRQHQIALKIVDAGVNQQWSEAIQHEDFIQAKIAYGTSNYIDHPAMSEAEAKKAIEEGKKIVKQVGLQGCNTIGFGEMGISNTSSASLIMSILLQLPIKECTGRGTGASDSQLEIKKYVLQKVIDKHELNNFIDQPIKLLSIIGGFEIAMMVGAYLQAAENKMVIVVDGFIATAALLVAHQINKNVLQFCIFAHASEEQGHQKMLHYLQAKPLLTLGLRLGEGTGAALAIPLIQSAVAFLNQMASFESAGVSTKM